LLLDKYELWSRRMFRSWSPRADGALLIGFPFSPLVYAARRLRAQAVPYVVDIGDPWVLTIAGGRPATRNFARARARRAERRLWTHAAGAIVTTDAQAVRLRERFPELPVLVRPNGFDPIAAAQISREPAAQHVTPKPVLRLAHFGAMLAARLNVQAFLERLADSGVWERVEFHQYGRDWASALRQQRGVQPIFHEPRPWPEIVATAHQYDAAVVIGNRDPTTLPSKAVVYLQLPVPRLAVVEDDRRDSLADYVSNKPGWLTVRADAADGPARVHEHVSRPWVPEELAPPESESWGEASKEVAEFLDRVLCDGRGRVDATNIGAPSDAIV
jgi:hypothetical protein